MKSFGKIRTKRGAYDNVILYVLDCCHQDRGNVRRTLTEVFPCFSLRCKANARV